MTLNEQLAAYSAMVEKKLMEYLQPQEDKGQSVIFEACQYSAMAGGKRLRNYRITNEQLIQSGGLKFVRK